MNVSSYVHKGALSRLPSVRQLRALVAVHQFGSVSSAADELSITQPAVTVLLRELEGCLGVKLFDRSSRRLRITAAGREALEHAERVLGELGRMADKMTDLANGHSGTVTVAATAAVAQTVLPRIIERQHALQPGIRVLVTEAAPGAFADVLLNGWADLGVGTLEAPVDGLHQERLFADRLVAVGPASMLFRDGTPMTWRELAAYPLIAVKRGYGIRLSIERAAAKAGTVMHIAHEVAHLGTALSWSEEGLGTTVLPASFLKGRAPLTLATRPLVDPVAVRWVALITPEHRMLSAAAASLTAIVRLSAPPPGSAT